MSLSPLHPISNFNSYISGEVTIDPSAVIAIGVVLQADPNSRMIIGAGVCIGMGTILHARDGSLEIEAGVTLGTGVLVIGKGKIGANACIGTATTILNPAIPPQQVIAPSSLIGDSSRQIAEATVVTSDATVSPLEEVALITSQEQEQEPETAQLVPEVSSNSTAHAVYGKASVYQLMSTLFPHRQSLNQPLPDDSSQSDA